MMHHFTGESEGVGSRLIAAHMFSAAAKDGTEIATADREVATGQRQQVEILQASPAAVERLKDVLYP